MRVLQAIAFLLALTTTSHGVETPDFLKVVQRYADTMIDRGRDTYGPQKSGLLLSALDRLTLTPLAVRPAPPGDSARGSAGPAMECDERREPAS